MRRQLLAVYALTVSIALSPVAHSVAVDAGRAALESTASARVIQAQVAPEIIHLPIVDAAGLRVRRLSTSDGLSQTRVAQIVQDDQGFMWFGTQYGINRYDGREFKLFVHEPGNPNSLSGAFVHALFKDRSGMLWIGCYQVVDRFDPRTETFTHYRIEQLGENDPGMTVYHIAQDRDGILWFASNTGLHRLDPSSGTVTHFRHLPDVANSLSTNEIRWVGEDRSGRFWVGTRDGLDEIDRATGTVKLHIPVPDRVQVSFFEDHDGRFWIVHATGGGLALYDRSSNLLTHYSFYEKSPPPEDLTGVMGIVEDHEQRLWLGSPGIGLLEFDRDQRRIIRYPSRPHDLQSIGEDKVIALYEDSAGDIWVGLHSVGPNYLSRRVVPFTVLKHDPDEPRSLRTDFVNAIYEDSEGVKWVGNDYGLHQLDEGNRVIKSITAGLGDKPMVITVTQDQSGVMWFGTYGHGLASYDSRTGHYEVYRHDAADPQSLSNDVVHRVLIDHTGTLWVGTEGGLNAFEPQSRHFRRYFAGPGDTLGQFYTSMAEDKEGQLWLGTGRSGLQQFDPRTGRLVEYRADPKARKGLRDNTVQNVAVSASGSIWIATQNGLNTLDPATGRISAYDVSDGMPANSVSCLLEDQQSHIWLSTNRGLSRFDPQTRRFANYSAADGLPGNDLTGWSACFKSARGRLYFGGFAGGVAFSPDQMQETSPPPRTVLTALEVAGATVSIGPKEILQESIAYTPQLILSHPENSFSLQFTGIDYLSPDANRYRYRLEGLDTRWYEVGSNIRRATYTTLAPGSYQFRLQASGARGPWSDPGVSLPIIVLPPWWATWWFRTAYMALIIATLGAVYAVRVRRLSMQLTIRMEERISERTRIARDLHDTFFQGIQGLLLRFNTAASLLKKDEPARLILDETLEQSDGVMLEGRELMLDLRAPWSETAELADALAEAGHELQKAYPGEFRVAVTGEPMPLHPIVFEELHRFAREALTNAFRHARAETIEAELHYERNQLKVRVRDDGVGINADVMSQGFRAGHLGLPGMRERAAKIGGHLDIWSRSGAGTEIELCIPAAMAYGMTSKDSTPKWLTWITRWGDSFFK